MRDGRGHRRRGRRHHLAVGIAQAATDHQARTAAGTGSRDAGIGIDQRHERFGVRLESGGQRHGEHGDDEQADDARDRKR